MLALYAQALRLLLSGDLYRFSCFTESGDRLVNVTFGVFCSRIVMKGHVVCNYAGKEK